jgi:hypothetical protein
MSTRWLVAASAAGFTLASVLCSVAWDIRSMIVLRALQGLCGGPLIPTAFTAAVLLFEGKQKAIAASLVSATAGLAPTLGPIAGGWLTDMLSWHWLFYINIVPGTLITLLVPILVRIDAPDPALLRRADYLGIVLMAVCLGCLDYVLEEGARWDWFGGRLWIDRLTEGLSDTGERLSPADGERIVRLVAHHVGAEVHPASPRVSAELPDTGERFEGLIPPVVASPTFAIRKPAVAIFTLRDRCGFALTASPSARCAAPRRSSS